VQDIGVDVGSILGRAIAAGLAPGWVGGAFREGEEGLCWCAGKGSQGGNETTADLWFDLASLTKPLVTTTLLLLACRDGLDLQACLGDLLPELAGSPWAGVTVQQCATHTAGFPAWEPLYLGGTGRDRYLASLALIRPLAAPGDRVAYSCLGFIAAGLALERAAGADLAVLFEELVARPLGLATECGFAPPRSTPVAMGERDWFVERALLGFRSATGEPPAARPEVWSCDDGNSRGLEGVAGNAGLFGSAAAVARLAAEYLPGGGELLDAEEAALATSDLTPGNEQARGLGWQLATTPGCSAGPAMAAASFGHTGFTGTSVWVDPIRRAVLVLLGNRLHAGGRTPDLHPLRRAFNRLALETLDA
jgi:serine-type D-Ala-D-Ala carboxypeptidase